MGEHSPAESSINTGPDEKGNSLVNLTHEYSCKNSQQNSSQLNLADIKPNQVGIFLGRRECFNIKFILYNIRKSHFIIGMDGDAALVKIQ